MITVILGSETESGPRYLPSDADHVVAVAALSRDLTGFEAAELKNRFRAMAETSVTYYRATFSSAELADEIDLCAREVARLEVARASLHDIFRAEVLLAAAVHVYQAGECFQAVC